MVVIVPWLHIVCDSRGRYLCAVRCKASGPFGAVEADQRVDVWDLATLQKKTSGAIRYEVNIGRLALSPDGCAIVSATYKNGASLYIGAPLARKQDLTIKPIDGVFFLTNRLFGIGAEEKGTGFWSVDSGILVKRQPVYPVFANPYGGPSLAASIERDCYWFIDECAERLGARELAFVGRWPLRASFSNDGGFAVVCESGVTRGIDLREQAEMWHVRLPEKWQPQDACILENGDAFLLMTRDDDGLVEISLCSMTSGEVRSILRRQPLGPIAVFAQEQAMLIETTGGLFRYEDGAIRRVAEVRSVNDEYELVRAP